MEGCTFMMIFKTVDMRYSVQSEKLVTDNETRW